MEGKETEGTNLSTTSIGLVDAFNSDGTPFYARFGISTLDAQASSPDEARLRYV